MDEQTHREGTDQAASPEWQNSYKTYRVEMPFLVVAHSEDQAIRRWGQFLEPVMDLG